MEINQGQARPEELFQAQAHLYKHLFSFVDSMCLKAALQLGIPDKINSHGRPITLPELLSALQIDPSKSNYLQRLMGLLKHSGLFSAAKVIRDGKEEEAYDLTPSSWLLLKDNDAPNLSPYAQAVFHPAIMNACQLLGDWFHRNDVSPFNSAFGMGFWDYASQNCEFDGLINEGMSSDSGMMNLVIKDCKVVFEGVKTFADVGGGKGSAAKIISEEFPDLECTVLDLPHVVENLTDCRNLKFAGGDMFHSIPSADAIFLKLVLHVLCDEECLKLLKKYREAISGKGKQGKVIIIDIVKNEKNDEHELTEPKLYYDLMMMVLVNGKERDEKEWEKLFLEAGFTHYKITPMFGIRSLIEVFP